MAIRRRQRCDSDGPVPPAQLGKDAWEREYPELWRFMTEMAYEDGSERRLPTVTVFVGHAGWQACLNDRDMGEAAFVTSGTVEGLWRALEAGLLEDGLDWRKSAPSGGKKKK